VKIDRFENIESWRLGRELAKSVYAVTSKEKILKDYGLKDQIQRAVGSIMHNITEGFDGGSNPEFIRFLRYAHRSDTEVQSQLYIALDQKYISKTEFNNLYGIARKTKSKIGSLIKYLLTYEADKKNTSSSEQRTKNQKPGTNPS